VSLLFIDGFDHHAGWDGYSGRKWDTGSSAGPSVPVGRFEGQCTVANTVGMSKTFTSSPVVVTGFAKKVFGYGGPEAFMIAYNGVTPLLELRLNTSTGVIQLTGPSNTPLHGESSFALPIGLWTYIEVKFENGGDVVIKADESVILSVSGVLASNVNRLKFRAREGFNNNTWNIDDLYILNGSGADNNNFLGDVRVQTRYPDATGFVHDFLPASGSNTSSNVVAQVNGPIANFNEIGLYNFAGTVGNIDLYSIGNYTVAGTIFGVQSNIIFRKDDVGNRSMAHMSRVAGSNYTSSTIADASADYTISTHLWEKDPATNALWILTDLNNSEFGVKVQS